MNFTQTWPKTTKSNKIINISGIIIIRPQTVCHVLNSRVQLGLLGIARVNAHDFVYRGGVGTHLSRREELKTSYKSWWMKQCPVSQQQPSAYSTHRTHLSQYGTEWNYRKWIVSGRHAPHPPTCEGARDSTHTGKMFTGYFNLSLLWIVWM